MIYISELEQEKIKIKIKKLPNFLKNSFISIGLFQFFGTFILAYGTCMSRYTHPISERHININYQFLTCCFFYFALSVAAPFSGGHLNPSVTLSLHIFKKINNKKTYIISQFLGGIIGTMIAYLFFGVVPFFYWQRVHAESLLLDTAAEAFGSFCFIFFWLLITETNYMANQYIRYLLLSFAYLNGKAFTLRRGCINPVIGIIFQIIAAIQKRDFLLFLPNCLPLIVGPIVGATIGVLFFRDFYAPLKQGIALESIRVSSINQVQQDY